MNPGSPLHVIIGWIDLPWHTSSLASLFCGDMFLGCHAAKYFGKSLLPRSNRRRLQTAAQGITDDR
eukprot:8848702-Karenia_brevis.AAC.1